MTFTLLWIMMDTSSPNVFMFTRTLNVYHGQQIFQFFSSMWQAHFTHSQDTFVKRSTLNLFLHHSFQLKLKPVCVGGEVVSSD